MTQDQTAAQLISRSQSHTEIVHAPASPALHAELIAECDDWCECGSAGSEYWGSDDDGRGTWRIHLDEPAEQDTYTADRSDYDV